MKNKLYIAYGSNLNLRQMAGRCPNARPVGTAMLGLSSHSEEWRHWKVEGAAAPVGIWRITKDCEKALDRYEGYPSLYRKEYLEIEHNGDKVEAWSI